MKMLRFALMLAVAAPLLSGCGTLKKFTGQRDDTILPGERVDILSKDQQVNPKPGKKDDLAACDPTVDVNCPAEVDAGVDQEATAPEDIQ